MSRALLIALVVVSMAGAAFAYPYGGYVGVYSDAAGTNCLVTDAGGFVQLFYFHKASPGATAIEFISDISGTVGWTYFGDNSPFVLKIGNFDTGVSLAYQSCLVGDIYLGSTAYGVMGQTPACTPIAIRNHPVPSIPGYTLPLAVDCGSPSDWLDVVGSYAIVNSDGTCDCAVPVEETNWGKIKSLYE